MDSNSDRPLTDAEIRAGWEQTFSTNNPFCPCDLRSFTKSVRWAEHAKRNSSLSTIKEMREALQELLNSAQPCLRYVASAAYENEYGDLRESIIHARSVLTKYPETNK